MLVNTGKTPCTDRMSPVHMYIFKASYHAPGADVSLVLYASTHRIGQNWVPQKVDTKDEVTSVVPQVVNIEPCHLKICNINPLIISHSYGNHNLNREIINVQTHTYQYIHICHSVEKIWTV
jgi:hypothetical protein